MSSAVTFTNLSQISQAQGQINIFAVVIEFTTPKFNSGNANDIYSASYTITDPSLTSNKFVTLLVFGNDLEQFPIIINSGNLIIFYALRKQFHRESVQLVANLRRNSYAVYYDKVDYITGFRPTIILDRKIQIDKYNLPPKPTAIAVNTLITNRINDILARASFKGRVHMVDGSRWIVSSCSQLGITNQLPNPLITARITLELNRVASWFEDILFTNSIRDFIPVSARPSSSNSDIAALPHVPLRWITSQYWRIPESQYRCDIICMVIGATVRESGGELVVWDGTLEGTLSLKHVVARALNEEVALATYKDICHSLHAAVVFSSQLLSPDDINSFYSTIASDNPSDLGESVLRGQPVVFTCAEPLTQRAISNLSPGAWIRARNVHLNYAPSVRELTRNDTTPVDANGLEIVGGIHSDTHITPILPHYQDARTIAARYREILLSCQNNFRVSSYTANASGPDSPSTAQSLSSLSALVRPISSVCSNSFTAPAQPVSVVNDDRTERFSAIPARQQQNIPLSSRGHLFTRLCVALASVSPNKFCIPVGLSGYWPEDVYKFYVPAVTTRATSSGDIDGNSDNNGNSCTNGYSGNNGNSGISNENGNAGTHAASKQVDLRGYFMFALRVRDVHSNPDYAVEADVIVYGEDALVFLGMESQDWSEETASDVKTKLDAIVASGRIVEIHVRSYLTLDSVVKGRVKRFRLFDTILESLLTQATVKPTLQT